jgi:putative membrane protein
MLAGMMRNALLVWLINALALLALPYVVPSVRVDSFLTALVAALILGLVNTLIRPILVLLTLPVTLVTLGLFVFVINALLFWFVASFVQGFSVGGFWSAFFGAIVYALISWTASHLVFGPPRVVVVRRDL